MTGLGALIRRNIKLYFKDYKGKHPELFSIGEV